MTSSLKKWDKFNKAKTPEEREKAIKGESYPLPDYAEQSGSPNLSGVSGDDAEAVAKALGMSAPGYEKYVKSVKKHGGKQIATPAEYQTISGRMRKKKREREIMARAIVNKGR